MNPHEAALLIHVRTLPEATVKAAFMGTRAPMPIGFIRGGYPVDRGTHFKQRECPFPHVQISDEHHVETSFDPTNWPENQLGLIEGAYAIFGKLLAGDPQYFTNEYEARNGEMIARSLEPITYRSRILAEVQTQKNDGKRINFPRAVLTATLQAYRDFRYLYGNLDSALQFAGYIAANLGTGTFLSDVYRYWYETASGTSDTRLRDTLPADIFFGVHGGRRNENVSVIGSFSIWLRNILRKPVQSSFEVKCSGINIVRTTMANQVQEAIDILRGHEGSESFLRGDYAEQNSLQQFLSGDKGLAKIVRMVCARNFLFYSTGEVKDVVHLDPRQVERWTTAGRRGR